jgi:hypothetical protein
MFMCDVCGKREMNADRLTQVDQYFTDQHRTPELAKRLQETGIFDVCGDCLLAMSQRWHAELAATIADFARDMAAEAAARKERAA